MYYSTSEDGGGEADPSHQTYNRLTHNTGGQSKDTEMNSTLQGNYEMGEYSTVSNYRLSHCETGEEVRTTVMKNEDKDIANPQEEWSPSVIYAQVDKKRSKKEEKSPPQIPQPYTSLEQMYAQVDKKKSKKREVSEDSPCKSGDMYSVVNKPSSPEIPQKSQLLLEDLTITQPLQ